MSLSLNTDGAEHLPGFISETAISQLEGVLIDFDQGKPGERLGRLPRLAEWLTESGLLALMSGHLEAPATAVRAILFDKSAATNWSLSWHQDRTIAVAGRQDVAGFGSWTRKSGVDHVEPPFELIERC